MLKIYKVLWHTVCTFFLIIFILCTTGKILSQPATEKLPWEDPNSGFYTNKTSKNNQTNSNSTTKIEVITNSSGGSRSDGKTISNEGTQKQIEFVNNFLKEAEQKIKNSAGGYGYVWTWEKKWKIGPDGKPYEVKESWHKGEINTNTINQQSSSNLPNSSSSSNNSLSSQPTQAQPMNLPTPNNKQSAQKTPVTQNSSTTNYKQVTSPQSIIQNQSSSNNQHSNPSNRSSNKTSLTQPINIAPPLIPPAEVQLVIQNPINNSESVYSTNVFPNSSNFKPNTLFAKNEPIPEDTRVKISLDFDIKKINPQNLKLIIKDNEGENEVKPDEFKNYRHIFRVPNLNDYKAIVYYNNPQNRQFYEIINVSIPVYNMTFQNRTIDSAQHRLNSNTENTITTSSTITSYSQTNFDSSSQNYSNSYSTFSISSPSNYSSDDSDLSDLYSSTNDYSSPLASNIAQNSANSKLQNYYNKSHNQISEDKQVSNININDNINVSDKNNENKSQLYSKHAISQTQYSNSISRVLPKQNKIMPSQKQVGITTTITKNITSYNSTNFNKNFSTNITSKTMSNEPNFYYENTSADYSLNTEFLPSENSEPTSYENKVSEKEYIISLSLLNTKTNHSQSFDFISDPYPTAAKISLNTQLNFSLDMAKDVQKESVVIVIYDGQNKSEYTLKSINGDTFSYSFNYPTQEAYVWIYGNTSKKPFSYKLTIPVAEQ